MSDKEIQAISCVCNDTITQEDKRLPIPPPERVKNDSIDSYTTGDGNPYTKYTYYLKENLQKEYRIYGELTILEIGNNSHINRIDLSHCSTLKELSINTNVPAKRKN